MLAYSEIKENKYIVVDGQPCVVLSSHVFRKQQRKPVNQTKLRNLITGKVLEQTYHQNDRVEEADLSKKTITYLFHKPNRQQGIEEYWFAEEKNPGNRFMLAEEMIGPQTKFLKANSPITALVFNDEIIGVELPKKIDLKVTEAAPAVKGNTATNATKQVVVETGATINVPLFVNQGEIIRVNTETGEYTERVQQ